MEVFHDTAMECHLPYRITQCYLLPDTSVTHPALTPAMQAGTRFSYPPGMESWVDLVDLIVPRPGVEPATFRSRVRCSTTKTLVTLNNAWDYRAYRLLSDRVITLTGQRATRQGLGLVVR